MQKYVQVCLWSVQCQGVLVQVDHDQTWTRFILCVNGRKKVFGRGDHKKIRRSQRSRIQGEVRPYWPLVEGVNILAGPK